MIEKISGYPHKGKPKDMSLHRDILSEIKSQISWEYKTQFNKIPRYLSAIYYKNYVELGLEVDADKRRIDGILSKKLSDSIQNRRRLHFIYLWLE
jgi:hypothetical protein